MTATILAAAAFQLAVYYLLPPIIWLVITRRLGVSWRFIRLGWLTWLTALPFIIGVPWAATTLLGGGDPARQALVAGIALSCTAGIVEETSRYVYYRRNATLRNAASWREAVAAGAGHGGMEALVLGLQVIGSLAVLLFFPQFLPEQLRGVPLSAAVPLINGTSRALIIVCHIGFTLMVWRAVSEQRPLLYGAAVVIHMLINLGAFVLPGIIGETFSWVAIVPILVLFAWTVVQIARQRQQHAVVGHAA